MASGTTDSSEGYSNSRSNGAPDFTTFRRQFARFSVLSYSAELTPGAKVKSA